MIDINSGSKYPEVARLSNFTSRFFVFDYIGCAGIESVLQALKEPDPYKQAFLCALPSREAKRVGTKLTGWKVTQELHWKGVAYPRHSRKYLCLITLIYDAAFAQDPSFKEDLLRVGTKDIYHSLGKSDPRETVLTEVELIYQLHRLRIKALTA